jgi:hypothetical protein
MNSLWSVSESRIQLYYLIVIILFIYSLNRYRNNGLFILVVLTFFLGLFVYFGKNVQNGYRIITVIYGLYLAQKSNSFSLISKNQFVTFSFFLFSVLFLWISFYNNDSFNLIFSQYSRYFLIYLFFLILRKKMNNVAFIEKMNQLFYFLILVQIILSIAKFIITGPMESIVGSLSFSGGSYAAIFPLLAFILLWMYRKGIFLRKDWIFIVGLVFIGFVSYKRAIWFMMPLVIGLFMFYVQKKKVPLRVFLLSAILIPLIFYLGVRLNPTLNKELKVWGSFDLGYALDYTKEYSFGKDEGYSEAKTGVGRGGASINLFRNLLTGNLTKEDWIGYGLTLMYVNAPMDDEYLKELLNINSIGSASGFIQSYVVFGFLGVFVTLLYVFSFLVQIKNSRIRYILIVIFCWEYFLYTGAILREPALSFLLIYLILYSNMIWITPTQFVVDPKQMQG